MKRIEFKLGMPKRGSWDGGWVGEDRNFTIVKTLTNQKAAALLGGEQTARWLHAWDDGWCASITARVVPKGERLGRSDGFSGYDWMVRNILDHGDTSTRSPEPASDPDPGTSKAAPEGL